MDIEIRRNRDLSFTLTAPSPEAVMEWVKSMAKLSDEARRQEEEFAALRRKFEEDYYRHCLLAMICCGDPTRDWNLVSPVEVVSEYERLCKKQPSVKKKELDYYEKKLNEFPEIKI